jgi:hypothetical protein
MATKAKKKTTHVSPKVGSTVDLGEQHPELLEVVAEVDMPSPGPNRHDPMLCAATKRSTQRHRRRSGFLGFGTACGSNSKISSAASIAFVATLCHVRGGVMASS